MPTVADCPDLVAQLDAKNGRLAPETIPATSRRKLWWRWQCLVSNRDAGRGCPFCSSRRV